MLDLGAAPGSWTLYAADKVGAKGKVVAIDRAALAVGVPAHVVSIEADALTYPIDELSSLGGDAGFDAVISDMAPRTSGHRFVDQSRSYELFSRALEIGAVVLRPGGRFVGKIFQGEDFETARARVRELFVKARVLRPESVRSESYEIYIAGIERR